MSFRTLSSSRQENSTPPISKKAKIEMHGLVPGSGGVVGPARGQTIRQLRLAAELEGFYRQLFLPLVRRATWRHGLSKEDARDVVQDAFVLAVVKLNADGNGRAWLMSTVDNLATNFRRKGARRARLREHWLDPSDAPDARDADTESWRQSE
jgi:DNA-directed RNA polymerase specialized sigma24 family protein